MHSIQANDKARTGFLAAVQARNLLIQTGLAQQTLATVWNLADIDKVEQELRQHRTKKIRYRYMTLRCESL